MKGVFLALYRLKDKKEYLGIVKGRVEALAHGLQVRW
jgi:hypothetical protein